MRRAAFFLFLASACTPSAESTFDETIEGTLVEGDTRLDDGRLYDAFEFSAAKGQRLTAELSSEDFDPTLHLLGEGDRQIAVNDDERFGVAKAKLDETLPKDGTYKIMLMAHEGKGTGAYRLVVRLRDP